MTWSLQVQKDNRKCCQTLHKNNLLVNNPRKLFWLTLFLQYGNECEMLKTACERNMAISFLHHGPCAGTLDRRNFNGKIAEDTTYLSYARTNAISILISATK